MVTQGDGGGRHIVSEKIRYIMEIQLTILAVIRYTSILVSVQKTEDLLRRHRKGKKNTFSLFGSGNNASSATIEEEEERFKQQMLVDIRGLRKAAEGLGVTLVEGEKDGVPGWNALLETAEHNSQS